MSHEDPQLLQAFYSLAASKPHDLFTVTSGDRTHQPASGAYPIAPEGKSLHERFRYLGLPDEALDVLEGGRPIADVESDSGLAMFGLQTPVPGDPVHLTLVGWNG